MLSNCVWEEYLIVMLRRGYGKRPLWNMVSSSLSFCFSNINEATVMNQQSKGRIRVKSAEASSFDLRTSEINEKEGLVMHPAKQSSSLEFLELNCGCNKNADTTMKWETKVFPIAGEPLQKHQSLDLSSILFGAYPKSKPVNAAGRYSNLKKPILRTKSTPFELMQQRDSQELDIKGNFYLESQPHNSCVDQAQKVMHVSSAELNFSPLHDSKHQTCNAVNAKQHDSGAFNEHSYMSLVEDPYFSSLSPSSARSKMSFNLPQKQDGSVLPCSSLSKSSTTLFPYYNSHDSLTLSTLTNFPPPLNQETAAVGKLFLKVSMAF